MFLRSGAVTFIFPPSKCPTYSSAATAFFVAVFSELPNHDSHDHQRHRTHPRRTGRAAEPLLAGFADDGGATLAGSEHDVRAALEKDMKEWGEESQFVKAGEDEYGLRSWTAL